MYGMMGMGGMGMGMGMGGMGMGMGMGGMGMRGMGMGGGMGMRGMQGMQGQQGMQGMQGMQPMMPPDPEDEEPEIREKQVQLALEFVSKPEVMPAEDEEGEERDQKMEQITQYLNNNMGLNEDEMNAVLKRSGLDPKAGDSTTDSDDSTDEDSDEELDYDQQQNRDMRGAIPLPITLSLVALGLSLPNHAAWWKWARGEPLPKIGQPLQHQLQGGSLAASMQGMTPPVVVINQPPGGSTVVSRSWGARRWMLTIFGIWFVVTWLRQNWSTTLGPSVRATVATLATLMGLEVNVLSPPDFANEIEEDQAREDLDDVREQLRSVRTLLLENKKSAMDEFERMRRKNAAAERSA